MRTGRPAWKPCPPGGQAAVGEPASALPLRPRGGAGLEPPEAVAFVAFYFLSTCARLKPGF